MSSEPHPSHDADFLLLFDTLLESEEVGEGRASHPLEDDEKGLLDRMARGVCSKDERKSAIDLLVSNREAMEYFADAMRAGSSREGGNR